MKNAIKQYLHIVLAALAIMSCMVVQAEAAERGGDWSHTKKGYNIATTGEVVLGKYQVFKIEGELEDINWSAVGPKGENFMYEHGDLIKAIPFVDPADVKAAGIECKHICKYQGKVIGIGPNWKNVYFPKKK